MNPAPPPEFRLWRDSSGTGSYTGAVHCPCCRKDFTITARVVDLPNLRMFAGTVQPAKDERPRKNNQVDAFEAFQKQERGK